MTDSEVWQRSGDMWSDTQESPYSDKRVVNVGYTVCFGLCGTISHFTQHDFDQKDQLLSQLPEHKQILFDKQPHVNWCYVWPRTARGAQARARFCYRMAALARLKEATT